jgi:hypothetical protein
VQSGHVFVANADGCAYKNGVSFGLSADDESETRGCGEYMPRKCRIT